MTQGELEARTLQGERAQATAPRDVSSQLRLTAQAEADAWQQSADAQTRNDQAEAANAKMLADIIAASRQQLESEAARYEEWSATTLGARETAGKAKSELERRGLSRQPAEQRQAEPEGEPQTTAEWWQQFEADLAGVDRAIEREHQAAIAAGKPWPPERKPQLQPGPAQEVSPESSMEPENQAARLDRLLGEAREAAQRVVAERDAEEARAEYAVRVEREAQAQYEAQAVLQVEGPDEAEIEL